MQARKKESSNRILSHGPSPPPPSSSSSSSRSLHLSSLSFLETERHSTVVRSIGHHHHPLRLLLLFLIRPHPFPAGFGRFRSRNKLPFLPFFSPSSPLVAVGLHFSLYLSLPCFFLSLSHQYTTVLFSSNEVNLPSLLSPLFLQVGLGSPTWPPPLAIAHRRRYHQWGEAFVRSKHWRPSLSVLCTFPPSNALHPPEKKTVSLLSIDDDLFLQSCAAAAAAAADGGGGWLVGTMAASVSISLPLIRSRMFSWKMTAFCFLACVKDFFFLFFFALTVVSVRERTSHGFWGEKFAIIIWPCPKLSLREHWIRARIARPKRSGKIGRHALGTAHIMLGRLYQLPPHMHASTSNFSNASD